MLPSYSWGVVDVCNARANKRNYTTIMGEWKTLYGEVPPESSLLLRKYRQMYHVAAPGRRLLRRSDDDAE